MRIFLPQNALNNKKFKVCRFGNLYLQTLSFRFRFLKKKMSRR